MNCLKTSRWLSRIGEVNLLVRERWTLVGVLERACTIFEIQHTAFIDNPATVTVNILNIVMNNIDKSESAIVVDVVGCIGSNYVVSPGERCTQVVTIVLLEVDYTIVVAVQITIQLISTAACITSTAKLERTSILHSMEVPIVRGSRARPIVVQRDESTSVVDQVAVLRIAANTVGSLSACEKVEQKVISLTGDDGAVVVDVSLEVVCASARHPIGHTRIDSSNLIQFPESEVVTRITNVLRDDIVPAIQNSSSSNANGKRKNA